MADKEIFLGCADVEDYHLLRLSLPLLVSLLRRHIEPEDRLLRLGKFWF